MSININNSLNSQLASELFKGLQDKPTTMVEVPGDTESSAPVNFTPTALSLKALHDHIKSLPDTDDQKIQEVRARLLAGNLGIFKEAEESTKTYENIASKMIAIDDILPK